METLEVVNIRLREHYGTAWNSWPIWRIVYSENQLEKRFGTYTDYTRDGYFLRTVSEWREVPKYRQWIQNKWVLERLTVVPDVNKDELAEKISYEPIWVFEKQNGDPLPYKWEAAKLVIDALYAAMNNESMYPKYVDKSETQEAKEDRIKQLEMDLFGNETEVGDALAHKQAIVVPTMWRKEN